jgi:hypothetical protein
MDKPADIKETLAAVSPDAMLADGFEEALVGIVRQYTRTLALYDYEKCVGVLMLRDGLTHEAAVDYMEYNVVNAWAGDLTPAFTLQPCLSVTPP